MGIYYVRYIVFWLPIAVITVLLRTEPVYAVFERYVGPWGPITTEMIAFFIQLFFILFMLLGWLINSAMAAIRFPRRTLSGILIYFGLNMFLIMGYYASYYGSPLYHFLRYYGGIFSYVPMNALIQKFIDYNLSHEIWATGIITACCLIGFVIGAVQRRVHPNPYRPRMSGDPG